MYIFLSRDNKKLCVKPSDVKGVYTEFIPNSWKEEIFGDKWSINVSDLCDRIKEIKEINKVINRAINKNYEPEFVDTSFCENCGIPLNESGTCPICDDGEEDY